MTSRQQVTDMTAELIKMFEDRFVCTQGEPKAWFDIPQRGGDPVHGVYVVYAVRGKDIEDVKAYFIKEVLVPLGEKALGDNSTEQIGGPFLYWRLSDKVQITYDAGWWKIYTRICILNDNLDPVIIDDLVKREGKLAPICAYSAGAY